MQRMPVLAPLVTVIILLGTATSYAQLIQAPDLLPPPTLVNGVLTIGNTVIQTDDAATQEELPGLGHKFELFGSMIKDTDPENFAGMPGNAGGGAGGNEVISTDTRLGLAFAFRSLTPGIKITALTNQIGVKYYFELGRTCVAGSPRIQLVVDADGDGVSDFTAHGHISPTGVQIPCPSKVWRYEDLTDTLPRWEVTGNPFPSIPGIVPNGYLPWKQFAAFIAAGLPSHKILAGMLLDGESCSFAPTGCGKAYYDLLTIENRTLEIWQDAVRK
jgi:hypothetical protein